MYLIVYLIVKIGDGYHSKDLYCPSSLMRMSLALWVS